MITLEQQWQGGGVGWFWYGRAGSGTASFGLVGTDWLDLAPSGQMVK